MQYKQYAAPCAVDAPDDAETAGAVETCGVAEPAGKVAAPTSATCASMSALCGERFAMVKLIKSEIR